MNHLITTPTIELPKGGCLVIDDDVWPIPRARVFDPTIHTVNPLQHLDYRKICDLIEVFDALFPRGDSTLTKDTGLEAIAEALEASPASFMGLIPQPDKTSSTGQIWAFGKVRRLMRSPVLKTMLGGRTNFSFNPRSTILARVNRKELGDFDAKAITYFLIAHYPGTIVIPRYRSYFHPSHLPMLLDGRLIATGMLFDDAVLFAKNKGLTPNTVDYTDFISAAMRVPQIDTGGVIPKPKLPKGGAGGTAKPAKRKRRTAWESADVVR